MARPCTICTAIDRSEIDLECAGGASLAAIAKKHDVTVDSLRRHKANHTTPALVRLAQQRQSEAGAVSVADRLEEVVVRAGRLLDKAEHKGALVASAQLLAQLRMTLETLAKISGELNDRPITNIINLSTSPDWLAVRSAILGALGQHPEAKADVIDALAHALPALEVGNG
jgi:transposase-like protein